MGSPEENERTSHKEGAIETLIERYYSDVLYFCASKIKSEKAEEVAQSAMLRIIENIHALKNPKALKSWMLTIANNECNDFFRKTSTDFKNLSGFEAPEDAAHVEETHLPENCVEREEMRAIVLEAIHSLPVNYSDCLILHYHHEETYAGIAKILGISESKVKSDLYRGRQKLKDMLDERLGGAQAFGAAGGLVPLVTTVLAEDMQTLVTPESFARCKEYVRESLIIEPDIAEIMNIKPHGVSKLAVGLTAGAATVVLATSAYLFLASSGEELPAPEPIIAPVAAVEPQEKPPIPESEKAIETVGDMIGETQAATLDRYTMQGVEQSAWQTFLSQVGAADADVAVEDDTIYTLYVLEKQDKQLLLIEKLDTDTSLVSVRYLFGGCAEPPPMIELTTLFDANGE